MTRAKPRPRPIPQHSSASNEHYTPYVVVNAVKELMTAIDLDPASSDVVNRRIVMATRYFDKRADGLSKPWHGRVYVNPPGGVTEDRKSVMGLWWQKLVQEYLLGAVQQAVFLGFTLDLLLKSQRSALWVGHLPFCIPAKRLQFLATNNSKVDRRAYFKPGGSPTHANIIVYLPPRGVDEEILVSHVQAFEKIFRPIGAVSCPSIESLKFQEPEDEGPELNCF